MSIEFSYAIAARVYNARYRFTIAALLLLHLTALVIMFRTEAGLVAKLSFLLAWGMLNFCWLAMLRRPALSAALSLVVFVILILLSQLKHDVVQMTVNFVDLMLIDMDSITFLFTIFPGLRWWALAALLGVGPAMIVLWRLDPFRVPRLQSSAAALTCAAGIASHAFAWPDGEWNAYYADSYVSKFARSSASAISYLVNNGLMESDASSVDRLRIPSEDICQPGRPRPHIIMIHDESSFDIRQAQGVRTPAGYGSHFVSYDGKQRKFIAESNGGSSWLAEYNVLAGLSSRSFGHFSYFVTRIAAGRLERGLALSLRRCGYETISLYPAYGAFMSARKFQTSLGMQQFYDARDLGAKTLERDGFFYDSALRLMDREKPGKPLFMFVYLAANHFPWANVFRPDLTPGWRNLGNPPVVEEYLRRQEISAADYRSFVAQLKKQFPAERFLIVRYGDHQPEFSSLLIDPGLDEAGIARKMMDHHPSYFTTYYAIDAINFRPAASPAVMDTIDAAYLPLVVQEAAGIPLDSSFEEQRKIMIRCNGVFFLCQGGAEARRFNRLLIDAGLIKGL
jgi:hypothetical protein